MYNKVFKKYTLVCAINSRGIVGWILYEVGGMNSSRMVEFIDKFISGKYKNNVIIMDNGGSHKSKEIGKYIEKEYIDGFTPHNNISSPGYKPMEFGYHYLGKHAPHKRLSNDMMCRTDFFKETLEEFLVKGEQCTHDIPFRKRHLPNFYEGYYDFNNGMRRFPDLKCYIPSEVIFKEFDDVKDKD